MKIAMMTDTYAPQINGVVTSIRLSAEELTRRGHQVYIFAPDFEGSRSSEGNVIRFPSTGYPLKAIKEFQITRGYGSIIQTMRRLEIDLIHSHDPGTMGLKAVPISRYLKIPHVHTYHTFWPDYVHYVPLGHRYAKMTAERFSSLFCNRCDGIIAPTRRIRDALVQYGTRTPVSIVPTGIPQGRPDSETAPGIRERFAIPPGRKILVYAGRIVQEKNVPFLLDVMEELVLKQGRRDLHLLLLGDGAARRELEERAARTGLKEYLSFPGFLPHEEVMDSFRQADLFVFASVTETQGLVLLEAMAQGLPAVVVDALGIGDVMIDGKGGFPVPADPRAFGRTLTELLDDRPLYAKKKEEACRKAEEYSLETCARKLEEAYQRVRQAHRSRPPGPALGSMLRNRRREERRDEPQRFEEAMQEYFGRPADWRNRYFIMRHGKSEANRQGVIVSHFRNGLSGYGLTEEGRLQIRRALREQTLLDGSVVLIASDFLRTRQTAAVAAEELNAPPPRTTVLLRERSFGRYELREDLYYKMVWQMDEKDDRNREYGVESPEEVLERVKELFRRLEEEYRGALILLISHGDTLQITQTWIEGIPPGLHRSLPHLETGEIRELLPR